MFIFGYMISTDFFGHIHYEKISKHIQNCTHRICSQSNKKKEEMLGNMHF